MQQSLDEGMRGSGVEHLGNWSADADPAVVDQGDVVRDSGDDAEVVGDEQQAEVQVKVGRRSGGMLDGYG